MVAGQEEYSFQGALHELCESKRIHEIDPTRTAMFVRGANVVSPNVKAQRRREVN
jgi:hypothetical protein